MSAQYVTLTLDRYDGEGNPYVKGTATFTPSLEFPDVADQMLVGMAPVTATFRAGSLPTVRLIANDTAGPQGQGLPGWTWNVTYSADTPGSPAAASYYVLIANGATQRLSALAQVPAAQPGQQYLPLPSGTPSAGSIAVANGTGEGSAWTPPAAALAGLGGLGLVAATAGTAGYTLVNGTGAIISWAVPADGKPHRFTLGGAMDVTSNTTGGNIGVSFTMPDGTAVSFTWITGTQSFTGFNFGVFNPGILPVKAGTTVTVSQTSPLTIGAAVAWPEIWAL